MKFNNETKIGILFVAVILILVGLTVKAGNFSMMAKGYEVKAHFKSIDGVKPNAPVTVNGMEVGRVKDIKIVYGNPTVMELTLWLENHAKLHEGASAAIKNMGFMGEKYVGLTTGDDSTGFLSAGSVIQGQEPANLDKLLAEGEVIAKNIKELAIRLNSDAIDEILSNMKVSMKNIASISTNVNERLEVNKHLVDDTMVNVNSASQNLDELSEDLKINPWKLLYKPKKEAVVK